MLDFPEAWTSASNGFHKRAPNEPEFAGDRQHHWRTVGREIPYQFAPLQSLTPFFPTIPL